jgi:hypothetical protein
MIAKVEMIGARVVKIDGFLHEAQPQHTRVKVDGVLGIVNNNRDVV